jgi:diguanylate cyclase (GGDEF)-like protein/PAS domain S-box-containing protein
MGAMFTASERHALDQLLAENATDFILKTDRKGYILHASPSIERWGLPLPQSLIGSHIFHLAHPSGMEVIRSQHEAVINRRQEGHWTEFPALTATDQKRWFEIRMRPLVDDRQRAYGAVSIMRSTEERRSFEQKLFNAAMTDPLTGLTNRPAFVSMLRYLVNKRIDGWLGMFEIDHLKAINLRHGQATGDEVLVVFADFLRSLVRSDDIISRVSGETLGVLLPMATFHQAAGICERIIATLSKMGRAQGAHALSITASAGLSRIGGSLDETITRAELALFLAKAKGRNGLEIDCGA